MLRIDNINTKAFHELVLYYLRERITHKNLEVKHLVVTNINEWFIFDVNTFEKLFAQNKGLVKQFDDFESGRLAGKTTDFFYKEIADSFIASITQEIEFTYFDIRDYQKPLRNDDQKDDNKLISLFKLLSPEHLLKLPFTNDSNTLDKRFYSELLHIIGLSESKEGGKKLIGRNKEGQRNSGSILEDAIIQLDSLDKISRLDKPSQYGNTHQERLFNVALELSITWINRILFLKLLEAQLISYHKGDKSYSFLNQDRIKEYDDLNILFFQVLARRFDERNSDVKKLYEKVPYLNSSLFEPTEMEQVTLFISNLKDDKTIPIISTTVLKDKQGKKRTGSLATLEYLFEFLNAYDFSSEGSEEIQEDNKTLINASVLGLIFEKINGYKDGSFFTPGFITMYMCRETIRKAVVQKFNETNNWNCTDFNELYDKIEDRTEANDIVNSIKICDPAVGSGHFLVSALNEMIAVKNDLKILQDRSGKRLKEYQVEIVNDELIVTDEEGDLFEYNPTSKESQRIQETLFHEKQSIIENCLFGVDININSVKICRLRLWIELLKNAYYKNPTELETLPNIDINIKCGNSLVSRFAIDSDLSQALKKSKWTIDGYRIAVQTYRNAENKDQKREMERLIADIKSDFRSEISRNDKKAKDLRRFSGELAQMTTQHQLFEMSKKEKSGWNKKVEKLTNDIRKLETEIEEIRSNKIFENAFEWRFEFPEVLNTEGEFVGFDVIIGNPPYIRSEEINEYKPYFNHNFETTHLKYDIYILFIEKAISIIRKNAKLCFIVPNPVTYIPYATLIRKYILENTTVTTLVDFNKNLVFENAVVETCIILLEKTVPTDDHQIRIIKPTVPIDEFSNFPSKQKFQHEFNSYLNFQIRTDIEVDDNSIINKIVNSGIKLGSIYYVSKGIVAYSKTDNRKKSDFISNTKLDISYKPYLEGKDVNRYGIKFKNQFLAYDEDVMSRPTFPKLHESPKILIRAMASSLQAYWDNEGYFADQKLIICSRRDIIEKHLKKSKLPVDLIYKHLNQISDLYLVGLLNSSLYNFYYKKSIQKGISILPDDIRNLPVFPNLNSQDFDMIVNQITSLKKNNPHADTTALENRIDQLVYQLYDLTEEEITIIENH